MLNGILTPAFLQAAGRAGKGGEQIIELARSAKTPEGYGMGVICTYNGTIIVESTYNGQQEIKEFSSPTAPSNINSDENTPIYFKGDITLIEQDAGQILSCDTFNSKKIETIHLRGQGFLKTLKIGNSVQTIDLSGSTAIAEIYYSGKNEAVATSIAQAIASSSEAHGTVYTDSTSEYYSTIATAATAKGWTIAQLPA